MKLVFYYLIAIIFTFLMAAFFRGTGMIVSIVVLLIVGAFSLVKIFRGKRNKCQVKNMDSCD